MRLMQRPAKITEITRLIYQAAKLKNIKILK